MRLVDPSTPTLSWAGRSTLRQRLVAVPPRSCGRSTADTISPSTGASARSPSALPDCGGSRARHFQEAPPPASNGTLASIPWSAPDSSEKFYEWESRDGAPDARRRRPRPSPSSSSSSSCCARLRRRARRLVDEKVAGDARRPTHPLRMVAVVVLVVAAAVALDAKEETLLGLTTAGLPANQPSGARRTRPSSSSTSRSRAHGGRFTRGGSLACCSSRTALSHWPTIPTTRCPAAQVGALRRLSSFFFTTLASLAVALTRGAVLTGRYVLMFPFCAAAWSGAAYSSSRGERPHADHWRASWSVVEQSEWRPSISQSSPLSRSTGALLFDGIFRIRSPCACASRRVGCSGGCCSSAGCARCGWRASLTFRV